jgi:hypothetical protein
MPVRIIDLPTVLRKLAKGKPTEGIDAELAAKWAINRIRTLEASLPESERTLQRTTKR